MTDEAATSEPLRIQTPASDPADIVRSLREAGKQARDPVGFHYLEILARRAQTQRDRVQQMLHERLSAATQAFLERDGAAKSGADKAWAAQGQESLRGLVERLGPRAWADAPTLHASEAAAPPELRSIRHFRSTWSKLSTEKQMAHAMAQAPKNAGPLNSHAVVLRSLALMREISPDYLHRFLSHVDTLARLDPSAMLTKTQRKPAQGTGAGHKKGARR